MFLLQVVADTVKAVADTVVTTPTTGTELVSYLVSVTVGGVLGYALKALEAAKQSVEKLPTSVKMAIVAVLSFGAAKLTVLLGVPAPGNPLDWTGEAVSAVLTALTILGVKATGLVKKEVK